MNDEEDFISLVFEFDASPLWGDLITDTRPQRLLNVERRERAIIRNAPIENMDDYATAVVKRILARVTRIKPDASSDDARLFLYNRYGLTFI